MSSAVAEKPERSGIPDGAVRLVLLDGVQDPGNVGTILRTAEALGFDGAALSHVVNLLFLADTYNKQQIYDFEEKLL